MKISKNFALTIVCVLLGIILAWQFRSINTNQRVSSVENKRLEDLKTDYINEKRKNDELQKKNRELIDLNSKYENAKDDSDTMQGTLKAELEKYKMIAGFVPVKGSGVVVKVDNNGFLCFVDDTNILDIVNELRASGAQAISVNDERIVAVSEVREAGNYVMVNGTRLSAPFTIKAIGDADKLLYSLKMTGGIIEDLDQIGLKVSVEKANEVVVPKVRDDGTVVRYNLLTPVK